LGWLDKWPHTGGAKKKGGTAKPQPKRDEKTLRAMMATHPDLQPLHAYHHLISCGYIPSVVVKYRGSFSSRIPSRFKSATSLQPFSRRICGGRSDELSIATLQARIIVEIVTE